MTDGQQPQGIDKRGADGKRGAVKHHGAGEHYRRTWRARLAITVLLKGLTGTSSGIVFDGLKADDMRGAGRAILPLRRQGAYFTINGLLTAGGAQVSASIVV